MDSPLPASSSEPITADELEAHFRVFELSTGATIDDLDGRYYAVSEALRRLKSSNQKLAESYEQSYDKSYYILTQHFIRLDCQKGRLTREWEITFGNIETRSHESGHLMRRRERELAELHRRRSMSRSRRRERALAESHQRKGMSRSRGRTTDSQRGLPNTTLGDLEARRVRRLAMRLSNRSRSLHEVNALTVDHPYSHGELQLGNKGVEDEDDINHENDDGDDWDYDSDEFYDDDEDEDIDDIDEDDDQKEKGKGKAKIVLRMPASSASRDSSSRNPSSRKELYLREISGDIFEAPDNAVIVHAVNCYGVWGTGFALELRQRFPAAFQQYSNRCSDVDSPAHLIGTSLLIEPKKIDYLGKGKPLPRRWIACLFTSVGFGRGDPNRGIPPRDPVDEILMHTKNALLDLLDDLRTVNELAASAAALAAMDAAAGAETISGNEEVVLAESSRAGAAAATTRRSKVGRRQYTAPGAIYSPRFNSGSFGVPWQKTKWLIEDIFERYGGTWTVVSRD